MLHDSSDDDEDGGQEVRNFGQNSVCLSIDTLVTYQNSTHIFLFLF